MEPQERKPIYGIGDKVKIVNYGSLLWENKKVDDPKLDLPVYKETENVIWKDMSAYLVGQEGIVAQVTNTQGRPKYCIDGLDKYAWYDEEQMELISKNPNN